MNSLRISRRDRRALLAGSGLILGLAAASQGVPAWQSWQREVEASAVEVINEAHRAERSIRTLPATSDSLKQRQQRLGSLAPALLSGETPAVAAAALASLVSGAAATAGLRLGALQVRVDSTGTGVFRRVAVRGDVTGDIRGITAMLAALEQGPKLLAVKELSLTQPEPAAPPDRPEALRMEFLVVGLALNRSGEAGR